MAESIVELLKQESNIPLIDDLDPSQVEHNRAPIKEFTLLLNQVRQIRGFLMEQLPLMEEDLTEAEGARIYSICTKAIVRSCLKLMGFSVTGMNVTELIKKLNDSGVSFAESSIYKSDGDELLSTTELALSKAATEQEYDLYLNTEAEGEILDALISKSSFHLGLLSKGLMFAYARLNMRLVHLVRTGKLNRTDAEQRLNDMLSLVSVQRLSGSADLSLPDSEDTTYSIAISPAVLRQIDESIYDNKKVMFVFDEVVSSGRTLFAFMKFLMNKYGEEVIHLIDFRVPEFRVEYVPVDDRKDFTEADVNIANMESPFAETDYRYVWRLVLAATGQRIQSFGMEKKEA